MKILKILLVGATLLLTLNAEAPHKVQPADTAEMMKIKKKMKGQWKAYAKSSLAATKGITVKELDAWIKQGKVFTLVDVREPKEVAAGKIHAADFKAIPRGMVVPTAGKNMAFSPDRVVVFYCKVGTRSALVAQEMEKVYGYKNLYYLKGGTKAWMKAGYAIENMMGKFVQAQK